MTWKPQSCLQISKSFLLRNTHQGEWGGWRLHPTEAQQLREETMELQHSEARPLEQMKLGLTIPTQSILLSEESSQTFPFSPQNKAIWENKTLTYQILLVNKCRAQILQGPEHRSRVQIAFCTAEGLCSAPTRKPAAPPCTQFSLQKLK